MPCLVQSWPVPRQSAHAAPALPPSFAGVYWRSFHRLRQPHPDALCLSPATRSQRRSSSAIERSPPYSRPSLNATTKYGGAQCIFSKRVMGALKRSPGLLKSFVMKVDLSKGGGTRPKSVVSQSSCIKRRAARPGQSPRCPCRPHLAKDTVQHDNAETRGNDGRCNCMRHIARLQPRVSSRGKEAVRDKVTGRPWKARRVKRPRPSAAKLGRRPSTANEAAPAVVLCGGQNDGHKAEGAVEQHDGRIRLKQRFQGGEKANEGRGGRARHQARQQRTTQVAPEWNTVSWTRSQYAVEEPRAYLEKAPDYASRAGRMRCGQET